MDAHRDALRRLAMNDEVFIEEVLSIGLNDDTLDARPDDACRSPIGRVDRPRCPARAYQWDATRALALGVTLDEIVGVLIAVAPIVGVARVVSAAHEMALAIGYDVDADLEAVDPLGGLRRFHPHGMRRAWRRPASIASRGGGCQRWAR